MTEKPITPEYKEPDIGGFRIDSLHGLNNALKYLGFSQASTKVYAGQIVSNAAGTVFPSGWTLDYVSSVPYYTINHTLGTDSFTVAATVITSAGTPITAQCYDKTTTSFRLYANSSASSGATTADIDFIVVTS